MVAQAQIKTATAPSGKLVLGATETRDPLMVVLVKFTFKDDKLIPVGVNRVERLPDYQVDVQHQLAAYQAGQKELGRVGRVREGRVDTGEQVVAVRRPVQAGLIRRGLANNGFSLLGLHWFSREVESRDPRKSADPNYVVCASFVNRAQNSEPTAAEVSALRELANMTWSNCYVWDNPNSLATINFVGLQHRDQKAKQSIVLRDGNVIAVDIVERVAETDE